MPAKYKNNERNLDPPRIGMKVVLTKLHKMIPWSSMYTEVKSNAKIMPCSYYRVSNATSQCKSKKFSNLLFIFPLFCEVEHGSVIKHQERSRRYNLALVKSWCLMHKFFNKNWRTRKSWIYLTTIMSTGGKRTTFTQNEVAAKPYFIKKKLHIVRIS